MSDAITMFRGENFFLSNFYPNPIWYRGLLLSNGEACYQSNKSDSLYYLIKFIGATGKDSKVIGKTSRLRSDWETVKYYKMKEVIANKFRYDMDMIRNLLGTGTVDLIEGAVPTRWGKTFSDKYWGGNNNTLGKILMEEREFLFDNLDKVMSNIEQISKVEQTEFYPLKDGSREDYMEMLSKPFGVFCLSNPLYKSEAYLLGEFRYGEDAQAFLVELLEDGSIELLKPTYHLIMVYNQHVR